MAQPSSVFYSVGGDTQCNIAIMNNLDSLGFEFSTTVEQITGPTTRVHYSYTLSNSDNLINAFTKRVNITLYEDSYSSDTLKVDFYKSDWYVK